MAAAQHSGFVGGDVGPPRNHEVAFAVHDRLSSYKDLNFLLFRLEKSYHTPKISMFWRFDPNMYENIV